jgi:hypothetical protein
VVLTIRDVENYLREAARLHGLHISPHVSAFYDGPFQGTSKDPFRSHGTYFWGEMYTLCRNKNHSTSSGKDEGSAIFRHIGPHLTSRFTVRDAKPIKINKHHMCMRTYKTVTIYLITTVIQVFYLNMERSHPPFLKQK